MTEHTGHITGSELRSINTLHITGNTYPHRDAIRAAGGRWNKTPEAVPPGAGVAVMPDFQFGGHKVEVYFNDVHDEPKTIDVHLDLLAQTDEAFDNWCKVRRESIAAEKAESRRKNDAVEREIFERLKAKFEPKQETPNGGGEDREP